MPTTPYEMALERALELAGALVAAPSVLALPMATESSFHRVVYGWLVFGDQLARWRFSPGDETRNLSAVSDRGTALLGRTVAGPGRC